MELVFAAGHYRVLYCPVRGVYEVVALTFNPSHLTYCESFESARSFLADFTNGAV